MTYPVISADSHVVEPANAYVDYVDRAWRERAPRMVEDEEGARYLMEGLAPVRIDVAASAGIHPEKRGEKRPYAEVHRGAWDPVARLAQQRQDGVAAEVIYPTIGMFLYAHPDVDFKAACFAGYNRWIAEFCAVAPDRTFGCAPIALKSPAEGIAELRAAKALGLRSVMLPNMPGEADYDSPIYDKFWEEAVTLGLPLAFHTLAAGGLEKKVRGSNLNKIYTTIQAVQELLGLFVLTGIFERHPDLRIVCVEGDAGWLPHYAQRMDRFYREHIYFNSTGRLARMPSEYIFENIYMTFQDDVIAFQYIESMNADRLMWANDFPHPDASWPHSQELLARQTIFVTDDQRRKIICDNAAALYGIDVTRLMH
jgi:predicted TIM-barrel fold metal-dependent hydrolase